MGEVNIPRFTCFDDFWAWYHETAVQAIRLGAYDFIEKPFKEARLLMMVERALENAKLAQENLELRARIDDDTNSELIGNSLSMRTIRQSIEKIAPASSRVLINGPSGSGKELAARAIHNQSNRSSERFVVANCARLASERVDSELFGAENLQSHRELLGCLNKPIAARFILMKYVICPWKLKGKIVRQLMNRDSGVLVEIPKWLLT